MTNYETPIIGDYVDPAELHELWTNGPLVSSRHPELPLTVYNYTSKRAIREEEWTPLVSACRGLVVRDDGLIVARPFSRMREIGLEEQLPPGAFTAFEKLDGTMGVQY